MNPEVSTTEAEGLSLIQRRALLVEGAPAGVAAASADPGFKIRNPLLAPGFMDLTDVNGD